MGLMVLIIVIIAIVLWLKIDRNTGNDQAEIEDAILSNDLGNTDWDELKKFLDSKGISEDQYRAIRLDAHRKRAEAEYADSQYWYALLIGNANKDESERYYKLAAEQDYIPAVTHLMYAYTETGAFGINPEEELYWTRKGTELGDVSAMLKLGGDYIIGDIVETNQDEAEKWFMKAAGLGSAEAYISLAEMTKYMNETEKRIQWLRTAIYIAGTCYDRDSYERAAYGLGWIYKPRDNNVNSDAKKSCYFFVLSYVLGDRYSGDESKHTGYVPGREEFNSWVEDARNLSIRM